MNEVRIPQREGSRIVKLNVFLGELLELLDQGMKTEETAFECDMLEIVSLTIQEKLGVSSQSTREDIVVGGEIAIHYVLALRSLHGRRQVAKKRYFEMLEGTSSEVACRMRNFQDMMKRLESFLSG